MSVIVDPNAIQTQKEVFPYEKAGQNMTGILLTVRKHVK